MVIEVERTQIQQYQPIYKPQKTTRLPLLLILMTLVLVCVFTVAAAILFVTKLAVAIPDPLALYVDILPGRGESVLAPHGFLCYAANDSIEFCALNRTTGAVRSIHVIVRFNIIYAVNIQFRSGALRLGDLALLWGRPDPHEQGYSRQFDWSLHNASVTVAPFVGGFSYLLPVQSVSFEEININRNRAL
jgi:hypothetical protein